MSIFTKMKTVLTFGLLTLVAQLAVSQEDCPDIPPNDVEMGEPVPMIPEDIPEGCSAYEILVGKSSSLQTMSVPPCFPILLTQPVARGTSEPNYEEGDGKFGFVVGDPVVSNVTEKLPEARGYPVQVCPK